MIVNEQEHVQGLYMTRNKFPNFFVFDGTTWNARSSSTVHRIENTDP